MEKMVKIPEIKIEVKISGAKKSELHSITSSHDAYNVFRMLMNSDTIDWVEECILLCVNRANKVVGYYKVSQGGTTGTIVDPKVIFTLALNCGASGILLAHNHPSGNLRPSESDNVITEKLRQGGKILDIELLDHLIITTEGYYSYADEGKLM